MSEINKDFYLREYGKIACAKEVGHIRQDNDNNTIYIHQLAWDELANIADSSDKENCYLSFCGQTKIKVQNYVGVIATKDGTQIEILPKISEYNLDEKQLKESRELLNKMIDVAFNVKQLESTQAQLKIYNQPVHQFIISAFLKEVSHIIKKGVRFDYERVYGHEKFLKGQLQLSKQVNEPPHRQHLFHIEYDTYSANRAENRLIKSALLKLQTLAKNDNIKLSRKLLDLFDEIPHSSNCHKDLTLWQNNKKDRSMAYYQSCFVWLKFILNQENPFTQKENYTGISFLFAMEDLFEKYVFEKIKYTLEPLGYRVTHESPKKYLVKNKKGHDAFQMKPDIVIQKDNTCIAILDTKWKLIDENATYENGNDDKKKDISQGDMYQLFAYAHIHGAKTLALIYPEYEKFHGVHDDYFAFDITAANTPDTASEKAQIHILPFSLSDAEEKYLESIMKKIHQIL